MPVRWTIAALGALALAWTVVTVELPWMARADAFVAADGASCPADAKPAPLDFAMKDVDGKTVKLSDYKGKVILLDFWATWCGPCKVEIPWFIEFQSKYGKQGFQAIGVSVDDPIDKLKPYVNEMKMNYVILQGLGHDNVLEAYGPVLGIPITVLISREGKICAKHTGMSSKDGLEKQIKALL